MRGLAWRAFRGRNSGFHNQHPTTSGAPFCHPARDAETAFVGTAHTTATRRFCVGILAEEGREGRDDITEDSIREVALPLGFVDIKVCAVSDVWSGLKLVIRKSERKI
jgi:hypothetical protein